MLPTYHFFFFQTVPGNKLFFCFRHLEATTPFQETNNFFVLGIWKPQLGQTKYLIVAALYMEVFHYGCMCSHYKFNECATLFPDSSNIQQEGVTVTPV